MNGEHAQMEETIAAYVTHGLDPAETIVAQTQILEHIAGCDECRALFRDLSEIAGDLALAAPRAPVSSDLESRLMTAVRGEQVPRARRSQPWPWRGRAALGAVAAALIALVVWNAVLSSSISRERARSTAAIHAMVVLSDPSARHATLASQGPGGSASVAVRADGTVAFLASGLPAAPSGKVYELWLVSGGTPVATAVFTPEHGTAIVSSHVNPGTYDLAAVTLERAPNGTAQPTSAMLYRGSITG